MRKIFSTAAFLFLGMMAFAQNRLQVDVSALTTNTGAYSHDGFNGEVTKTVVDADGKIYCIGNFSSYNGTPVNQIARLLSTGQLDNTFQTGTGFTVGFSVLKDILIQQDGKIIIAGSMSAFNGSTIKRGLVRLLNNGTIDNSFQNNTAGITFGSNIFINTIDTLSNGDYVIGGNFTTFDLVARPAIAILNRADGSLNTTANATFIGTLNTNAAILDLTVNGNDEITAVGVFELNVYGATMKNIARFKNGLVPDATFASNGAGGYYTFNNEAETVLELSDGSLFVGGLFRTFTQTGSTNYPNFICLNSDGTHNTTFTYPTMAALPVLSGMNVIKQAADGSLYFLVRNRAAGAVTDLNRIIKLTGGVYTINTDVVTDGMIVDLTPISNNNIVLAGSFQKFGASNYVNRICKIDDSFTNVDFAFNNHVGIGIGNVNAVFTLSDGSTLIGGSFKGYDNVYKSGIIRINADGTVDATFQTTITEEVFSFAEIGTGANRTIAVGADKKLYFLDNTGANKTGFTQGTFNSGNVRALLVYGSYLYVGGSYYNYNGNSNVERFTRFSTTNGALDATYNNTSNSNRPIVNGTVNVLKIINNVIYIGGEFSRITYGSSNTIRYTNSICKLTSSGATDTGLLNSTESGALNGTASGIVNDIIEYPGNNLILVGKFNIYKHSTTANQSFNVNNIVIINNGAGFINQTETNKFLGRVANTDEIYAIKAIGSGTDARYIFALNSTVGYAANAKYKTLAVVEQSTGNPDTYYSNTFTDVIQAGNVRRISEITNGGFYIAGSFVNPFDADKKRAAKLLFAPAPPVLSSPQTFCMYSNPQIANLDMNGYINLKFYDAAFGGNAVSYITILTNGTTYYAADVVSGTESTLRTPVTVYLVNELARRDTVVACGSYTWTNGQTYTSSTNTSYVIGSNPSNCDSVAYLVLTINQNATSTVRDTACETFTWTLNNQTYTSSTVVSHTLAGAAANGCDSTVTLELVIKNNSTSSVSHTECNSYTWSVNAQTYTASGSYTATIPNFAGCDSTITLNLTINYADTTVINETACGSFTWTANSQTYTATQKDTLFLTNANACDSIVILDLIINQPSATNNVTVTHCGSDYNWNNVNYTANGQYTQTLQNALGCDSVVILDLILLSVPTKTETVTSCDYYTWPYNNITYNVEGVSVITATVPNGTNCDSVITLNLTIVSSPYDEVQLNNGVLTASETNATYQWYDCETNTAIAGATERTFTPTALNKEYKVELSNGDCSSASNCVFVPGVGIDENNFNVSVFPNPTQNVVQVNLQNATTIATISVIDMAGKTVLIKENIASQVQFDLSNYADGVYFIKVQTKDTVNTVRVIKY